VKLLRQPLLHFLLLGAAIFALNSWLGRGSDQSRTITIRAADVTRMADVWERQWRRPPTTAELRGLVDQQIHEEIFYREALAQGLDKDDVIVRRRLAQKLEFLAEDLTADPAPTDADLDAFFGVNPERYREPPRLSFSHLYFSRDRHGADTEAIAAQALARLDAGHAPDPAAQRAMGDPFMLQNDFVDRTPAELDRLFGADFGERVAALPTTGKWQGPIASGYGLHLILVTHRSDAHLPALADVRDTVQRDFIDAKRREANATFYQQLRSRYRIDIAPDALPAETAQP
jgi:peptidyl-prolyl cis-trans isomerase C